MAQKLRRSSCIVYPWMYIVNFQLRSVISGQDRPHQSFFPTLFMKFHRIRFVAPPVQEEWYIIFIGTHTPAYTVWVFVREHEIRRRGCSIVLGDQLCNFLLGACRFFHFGCRWVWFSLCLMTEGKKTSDDIAVSLLFWQWLKFPGWLSLLSSCISSKDILQAWRLKSRSLEIVSKVWDQFRYAVLLLYYVMH